MSLVENHTFQEGVHSAMAIKNLTPDLIDEEQLDADLMDNNPSESNLDTNMSEDEMLLLENELLEEEVQQPLGSVEFQQKRSRDEESDDTNKKQRINDSFDIDELEEQLDEEDKRQAELDRQNQSAKVIEQGKTSQVSITTQEISNHPIQGGDSQISAADVQLQKQEINQSAASSTSALVSPSTSSAPIIKSPSLNIISNNNAAPSTTITTSPSSTPTSSSTQKPLSNNVSLNQSTSWGNLSLELLKKIFSVGKLTVHDLCHCLQVSQYWRKNCNSSPMWRIVCLNSWSLGSHWIQNLDSCFSEDQNNNMSFKAILQIRELLGSKRKYLEHRIEEGYSIMAKLLHTRNDHQNNNGDPVCYDKINDIMKTMDNDITLEKFLRQFESQTTRSLRYREEDAEDLYYLVNNTFLDIRDFDVTVPTLQCTVITKLGSLLRVTINYETKENSLKDQNITEESGFSLEYTHESTQGVLFEYQPSSNHIILHQSALKYICTEALGLTTHMAESRVFFYLWKYCLSFPPFEYRADVAEYLLTHYGWEWDSCSSLFLSDDSYSSSVILSSQSQQSQLQSSLLLSSTSMNNATTTLYDSNTSSTTQTTNHNREETSLDVLHSSNSNGNFNVDDSLLSADGGECELEIASELKAPEETIGDDFDL